MRVYHGSYMQVMNPDVTKSRKNVDFGQGFYITPIMEQAYNWAKRFKNSKGQSIVSVYEFDMELIEISPREAMDFFYQSLIYREMSEGVSDMHCRDEYYLAEELKAELAENART